MLSTFIYVYTLHVYSVLFNSVSKIQCFRIVEKDKDELHMKTFTYHPTQEDENSLQALDAPGNPLCAKVLYCGHLSMLSGIV